MSLFNGGIILCGGINVLMTQEICNKADVAGFLIKGGSVSAAELMGGDMLSGNGFLCKFFDYIFLSEDTSFRTGLLGPFSSCLLLVLNAYTPPPGLGCFL